MERRYPALVSSKLCELHKMFCMPPPERKDHLGRGEWTGTIFCVTLEHFWSSNDEIEGFAVALASSSLSTRHVKWLPVTRILCLRINTKNSVKSVPVKFLSVQICSINSKFQNREVFYKYVCLEHRIVGSEVSFGCRIIEWGAAHLVQVRSGQEVILLLGHDKNHCSGLAVSNSNHTIFTSWGKGGICVFITVL